MLTNNQVALILAEEIRDNEALRTRLEMTSDSQMSFGEDSNRIWFSNVEGQSFDIRAEVAQ